MKLFEFAILYHPMQTKEDADKGVRPNSEIVVDVTRVLAKDVNEVTLLAARKIPENLLDKLDRVEVAVRPF